MKTAVDHQAYSLPQNQGLSNYSIDDELIVRIQQNYHYPFKNLVEFSDYLEEYQQQFDSLVIKIINRIEKFYK